MEYEVDLRRLVGGIVRRWWIVVGCALLFAIIGAAVSLLQPLRYTASASALMLIQQTGSQIGTNEQLLNIETIDTNARREGILAIARSDAIEATLPPDVASQSVPQSYEPGMLVREEYINVYLYGDLIVIEATTSTPQQAKQLADAWAHTFVDYVDRLYGGQEQSEVRFASEAVLPYEAASRGVVRNAVLSSAAGAILGILAALMLELFRHPTTERRRIDGERLAGSPSPARQS